MAEEAAPKRTRARVKIGAIVAIVLALLVTAVSCSVNTLLSDPTSQSKPKDKETPEPSFAIPADDGDEGKDDETDNSAANEPSDTSNPFGNPGDDEAPTGQPNDGGQTYAMPKGPSDNDPFIPDPTGPDDSDDEDEDQGERGDDGKDSDDGEGTSPIVPPSPPNPNPGDDDDEGNGFPDDAEGVSDATASANASSSSDGNGSNSDSDSEADSDEASDGSGDNAAAAAGSGADGDSTGSADGSDGSDGSGSDSDADADGSDSNADGSDDGGEDPDPGYPPVSKDSVVNGLNDKRGEAGSSLLVTEAPEDADAYEASEPFGQIDVTVTDGDAIDELLASALDRFNLLRDHGDDAVVVAHVETREAADGIHVSVSYEVFTPIDPVAGDDEATIDTAEDESVLIDVTGNDEFGGDVTIAIVDDPKNGQAVVEGTSIRYTPDEGDSTSDRLKYSVTDSREKPAEASVTITVERADEPNVPDPTASVPAPPPTDPSPSQSVPAQ